MKLILRIAYRYILALRKASTVQILSMLSVFGVFLGSMAMLLVLSAFNGFEGLLKRVYHYQDPDLRILPAEGKVLLLDAGKWKSLQHLEGVSGVFEVISDKASIQFGEGQMVAEIFAADPAYFRFCRMDTSLIAGMYSVADGELPIAMVSEGIRQSLQISFKENFSLLKLAYPKRSKILKPGSGKIFNTLGMRPSGSLGLDENRVFAPLTAGRRLMERSQGCNFVDVFSKPGADSEELASRIRDLLGDEVQVKNEYQLHEDLFKVMAIEKLFVFLALGFIILISGFNLFVSSSMMVLNKQKDFSIMSALGMEGSQFAYIIRSAGMMLVLSGLIPGLIAGSLLCFIQMKFEIIPLGMSSSLVKAYPVELHFSDVVAITGWVLFSGMLALFVPSRRAGLLKMQL